MKLVLLLLSLFLIGGCNSVSQKKIQDENLKEILIDPEKVEENLDLSEILTDSFDIIPLETSDECLISHIKRIEFYRDRIYVSDEANAKIFVFSSEGKYLKSIGKQGMGPDEYSFLGDFTFKEDSIVIQDRSRNKYIIYDLNSHSYREVVYEIFHMEVVSFEETAYMISNYGHSKLGDFNLFKFNLDSGKLISCELPFKESFDKSGYGLRRYSSKCGDSAMLIYPLNDTIYTLNKEGVFPSYVVHFTSRNLPEKLDVDRDMHYEYVHKNGYLKGLVYMQNANDYLLGYYIDEDLLKYMIYSKLDAEVNIANRLIVSKLGDMPFFDFFIAGDDCFCTFKGANSLLLNWNSEREKCTNQHFKKKMDSIVESLEEDSNPVIIKGTFRSTKK